MKPLKRKDKRKSLKVTIEKDKLQMGHNDKNYDWLIEKNGTQMTN